MQIQIYINTYIHLNTQMYILFQMKIMCMSYVSGTREIHIHQMCVCVHHLYRCKTSCCRGPLGNICSQRPAKTLQCSCENVPALLYIQSHPWAHLSRKWGGYIVHRCCFIPSTSTVILYKYVQVNFHRVNLYCWCFCTTDAFQIKICNGCSDQVCYSCRFVKVA